MRPGCFFSTVGVGFAAIGAPCDIFCVENTISRRPHNVTPEFLSCQDGIGFVSLVVRDSAHAGVAPTPHLYIHHVHIGLGYLPPRGIVMGWRRA